MSRNIWFLFILLIFSPSLMRAQSIVNIESIRPRVSDLGYKGDAKIEFNGNSGNSERIYMGLGHNSVWNYGVSQQFFLLNYRYGESQGIKDANESFLHLRHVKPLTEYRLLETYIQTQTNQFNRLRFRGLTGGGWRWELTHDENVNYALGTGLYFSHEEIYETSNYSAFQENMARGNLYLSAKSDGKNDVTSVLVFYYQPRMDQVKDFLILVTGLIRVKWTEKTSLSFEATLSHDSIPPPTVRPTDINYVSSLLVHF